MKCSQNFVARCRQLTSNVRHRRPYLRRFTLSTRFMATAPAHRLAVWLAFITFLASAQAASPVNKCIIDGKVTFQNTPCATEKPSRQPTVEELNAARKKRLAETAAQAPSDLISPPNALPSDPRPPGALQPDAPRSPTPSIGSAYRCDGRTHCSQMRSCSEAKFFLANCPGVKMDGNRDGTPCEKQWCTHPMAK